jgi:hypothetical protein
MHEESERWIRKLGQTLGIFSIPAQDYIDGDRWSRLTRKRFSHAHSDCPSNFVVQHIAKHSNQQAEPNIFGMGAIAG